MRRRASERIADRPSRRRRRNSTTARRNPLLGGGFLPAARSSPLARAARAERTGRERCGVPARKAGTPPFRKTLLGGSSETAFVGRAVMLVPRQGRRERR